jgi:uncharacterized membrane protein YphA (DoxX/SURF4 family)
MSETIREVLERDKGLRIYTVYAKEHPVVFWFAFSMWIAGIVTLLAPSPVAATEEIPRGLQLIQALFAIIGGGATCAGLLFLRGRWEAFGCALMAVVLAVNAVAAVQSRGWDILHAGGWITQIGLVVGLTRRSIHLARISTDGDSTWTP